MALEKQISDDLVAIDVLRIVQVRQTTQILEDGKILSSTYHRRAISPGDDYSEETDFVKSICQLVHTPQAIDTYKQMQKKEQ